jgi:putative DNA primase/helicase
MQTISAVYQYRNLAGDVVHETLRYGPEKDFRQRRTDGVGGYIWNLQNIEPVLYRLPEITEALRAGTPVFLVEGEKDADNLVKMGFEATTSAMGAGKWRDSYTEALRGAQVLFCPDNDAAGQAHAANVANEIYFTTECVKFVLVPRAYKDVSDWIAAGGTAAQLRALADAAPIYMPYDLQLEYLREYKRYTTDELLAEIEYLKTAPLRYARRAQLIEWALKFNQEALKHKTRKKGGVDLSYATT